jgi:hypothetical protein
MLHLGDPPSSFFQFWLFIHFCLPSDILIFVCLFFLFSSVNGDVLHEISIIDN